MIQVERRMNSHAQKPKVSKGPHQIKCASKKGAAIKQPTRNRGTKNPTTVTNQQKPAQETVVVNKDYLDRLLKMSVQRDRDQAAPREAEGASHVVLDHSQIPGLQQQSSSVAAPSKDRSSKAEGGRVATQHHRSVHDQWLDDLAAQAQEQKMRKEEERKQKKLPMAEKEYNPWGKPGCGAPMRTSSGKIPTDFHRKAVITGPRGVEGGYSFEQQPSSHRVDISSHYEVSQQPSPSPPPPHHPPSRGRQHKDWDENYNPWGKPGCGAAMRTNSGNAITDFRRRAVITGPNHEYEQQGLVDASHGQIDSMHSHGTQPTQRQHFSPDHLVSSPSPPPQHPPRDEDYNPWGRPGCGAPMATGPETDYRRHAVITGPKSRAVQKADARAKDKKSTGAPPTKHSGSVHPSSPSDMHLEGTSRDRHVAAGNKHTYARGPGPHVDSYMLKEKEEAKRRERERMAYIQQQIAEKERKKMEEKLCKEEEDRKEEERLYRERMDAERRREMEANAAREREDKAAKRKAMLHRMTEQARQEAEDDRMEAMALKGTHRITHKQMDDEPEHYSQLKPPRQTSTLRSPSLLHMVEQSSPRHGSTFRKEHTPQRPEEGSPSPQRAMQSRIPRPTQKLSKGNSEKVVRGRGPAKDASRSGAKKAPSTIQRHKNNPTVAVSSTALVTKKSKRLNEPSSSSCLPPPSKAPPSPPVPALRKKLGVPSQGPPSPPPELPHRVQPASMAATETETRRQYHSPPGVSGSSAVVGGEGNRSGVRASSPPVPALKKKLESGQCPAKSEINLPPIGGSHGIVADQVVTKKGHHPPSVPTSHQNSDRVHLPPVSTGPTHDAVGDPIRPPTMTRQKRLLQELAILREQIITQKLDVDEKVRSTLSRKLNAQ